MFRFFAALTTAIVLCFSTPILAGESLDKATESCDLKCRLSGFANKLLPPATPAAPALPPQKSDKPKAEPTPQPSSSDPLCSRKGHVPCPHKSDKPKAEPIPQPSSSDPLCSRKGHAPCPHKSDEPKAEPTPSGQLLPCTKGQVTPCRK